MGIVMFLLGALAVLPGQEAQEPKPELLQFAQLARLPLEPVESPLGRSVFVVGKRSTSGSTFVAAVDGTTGERRWKFEIEGAPRARDSVRGVKSSRGSMLVVTLSTDDAQSPQKCLVLDATSGALLRELTLPGSETCVALELELDGQGWFCSMDREGKLRRRDMANGGEFVASDWRCDVPFARVAQVPDETGDGVPDLVVLSCGQTERVALHSFDGLTLKRRHSVLVTQLFRGLLSSWAPTSAGLDVVAGPRGVQIRVSDPRYATSHNVLLDTAFVGIAMRSDFAVGEALVLDGSSLALLQVHRESNDSARARFFASYTGTSTDKPLSEVVLAKSDYPYGEGIWLPWLELRHNDSTLWITLPIGNAGGDEPVLAAYDVATGREVWKSENLLR